MIDFKERQVPKVGLATDVFLDGKKVGTIYRVIGGYQYQINKKHVGEVFPTLLQVKQSIVGE